MAQHSNGWVYGSLAHEIFTKLHGNSVSWEKKFDWKSSNPSMFDIFWLLWSEFSGQNFAYIIRILQEYLYNFNRNSDQKSRWLQLIIVINLTKYWSRLLSLLESGSWDSGKTPLEFLRNLVPIRIPLYCQWKFWSEKQMASAKN